MIIISTRILGTNFTKIAYYYADKKSEEKNLDKKEVGEKLNNAKSIEEFKENFEELFGDEIKLDIKKQK
ncbi:MAG: hypothetical protein ACOCZ5_00745 [bacterium]